jgi:hypothetical protein
MFCFKNQQRTNESPLDGINIKTAPVIAEIEGIKHYGVSEDIILHILRTHVEPSYVKDVKDSLNLRKYFRRFGLAFEILSKIFVGFTSILSFSSGIYDDRILSFVAGTTSVISLVFLQFSSHSYKESKKSTEDLNRILQKLNIEGVIDISKNPEETNNNSTNNNNNNNNSTNNNSQSPFVPVRRLSRQFSPQELQIDSNPLS